MKHAVPIIFGLGMAALTIVAFWLVLNLTGYFNPFWIGVATGLAFEAARHQSAAHLGRR